MARPPVREERRAQILDAMFEVIAARGAAGASISEIADAAGIARGALHYFFASKDEINCELMRTLGARYLEKLGASLDKRIAKASDTTADRADREASRARLVGDVARWHFLGDADDVARRITVWIDFWGQAASHPEIRAVILEIQEGARGLFGRALIAQRPELAALHGDALRPHTAALLALVEGTLLQWRFGVSTSLSLPREQMADAAAIAAHAIACAIRVEPSAAVSSPHRISTNPRLVRPTSQAA